MSTDHHICPGRMDRKGTEVTDCPCGRGNRWEQVGRCPARAVRAGSGSGKGVGTREVKVTSQ